MFRKLSEISGRVGPQCERPLEPRNRLVPASELGQDHSQVMMGLEMIGSQSRGVAQADHRLIQFAQGVARRAAQILHFGVIGILRQHLSVKCHGLREAAGAMSGLGLCEQFDDGRQDELPSRNSDVGFQVVLA